MRAIATCPRLWSVQSCSFNSPLPLGTACRIYRDDGLAPIEPKCADLLLATGLPPSSSSTNNTISGLPTPGYLSQSSRSSSSSPFVSCSAARRHARNTRPRDGSPACARTPTPRTSLLNAAAADRFRAQCALYPAAPWARRPCFLLPLGTDGASSGGQPCCRLLRPSLRNTSALIMGRARREQGGTMTTA